MLHKNLRFMIVALGAWVVISSFLWRQDSAIFWNGVVTGLVVVVSALLSSWAPGLRLVSTAAGVWLIASMFAWPNYASPAVWMNAFVGAAIALIALVRPEHADMISS
jgi:hypothetical protein